MNSKRRVIPRNKREREVLGKVLAAQIGEELQELHKKHPYQNWVDMVVVLSKGIVDYGCQLPFQP
jgi:hypothetical protein